MVKNSIDRKKVCDELKIKRAKLFGHFLKHSTDTRLALAIKLLDDQIADCTEWIRKKDSLSDSESVAKVQLTAK